MHPNTGDLTDLLLLFYNQPSSHKYHREYDSEQAEGEGKIFLSTLQIMIFFLLDMQGLTLTAACFSTVILDFKDSDRLDTTWTTVVVVIILRL